GALFDQCAARAARRPGVDRAYRLGRDTQLLGAPAGWQDGRDPGPDQHAGLHPRRSGRLPGPMRRVLRHRPCRHAVSGGGARQGRSFRRACLAAHPTPGVSMTEAPDTRTLHEALDAHWRSPSGWRGMSAVNHTAMGRRFMAAALCFFLVGGVLAMLIRAQLATSHSGYLDSELYSQIFTMHGTVMMFLFAIPMLEGFAFYLLPKMLGARDLAFPRLGAYAWWCY